MIRLENIFFIVEMKDLYLSSENLFELISIFSLILAFIEDKRCILFRDIFQELANKLKLQDDGFKKS